MKQQSYLTAILATAAIASSSVLVSINPAEACPFSKMKGSSTAGEGISKFPTTFVAKDYSDKLGKLGIVAAGLAAITGLGAAAMTYKNRVTSKTEAATAQSETEYQEVPADYIIEKVLTNMTVDELSDVETQEKEAALVK